MITKINKLFQKYIFSDELSLNTRRTNTMFLFGFVVAVCCVIVRFAMQATTVAMINQFAFVILVAIGAILFNKSKLGIVTIYFTIFILNIVLLPITFFANGGWEMAISGFFAMGLAIIVMVVPGKKAIPFVVIDVAWIITCYTILLYHPELVSVPKKPQFYYYDNISAFILVAMFFACVIRIQDVLFERERMKTQNIANELAERTEYRELVNTVAIDLLDADKDTFGDTLVQSMGSISKWLDMDRAFIFTNIKRDEGAYFKTLYSWSESPDYEDNIELPYRTSPKWYKQLSTGEFLVGSLDDMTDDIILMLKKYEVKSLLAIPLFIRDQFEGFILFLNHEEERKFSKAYIDITRMAALVVYSSILRNNATLSLLSARDEAMSANRAKSDFLSNMSHEMRTPMNAIIGMLDIACNTDDAAKKDYSLEKMKESSMHMLAIINDVLDMSKIEAGKMELSPADFSLHDLIEKIITLGTDQVKAKGQNFIAEIDPAIPDALYGDDQRLSQVITNLLSNAVKFTPNGGEIRLGAKLVASEGTHYKVEISVADSGIGISEEQKKLLFNPFQQAELGTSRRYGGTGLGLAISKRIVETMSGSISLVSAPGEGSTFSVTVPLTAAKAAVSRDTDATPDTEMNREISPMEFSNKCLLLAEDVEINREILATLLEPSGIEIAMAINGAEAVEMYAAAPEKYDFIFMDIQMPELDGYEATKRIRALSHPRAARVPIVALTANVFKDDVEKCLAAGMDSHIGKPLSMADVTFNLRKYLFPQDS